MTEQPQPVSPQPVSPLPALVGTPDPSSARSCAVQAHDLVTVGEWNGQLSRSLRMALRLSIVRSPGNWASP